MNNTIYTRQQYLEIIRKEKSTIRLVQVMLVVVFLAAWEIAAYTGIIDAFIVSSPSRMVSTFFLMAQSDLAVHILYTVGETIVGFTIGVVLGFFMAVGLWYSDFVSRAIITMAVAISLIVTVMELSHGFYATDKNMMVTVQSFGADKWQIFQKVVMPCNIPVLFQSLKVNIGLSLVGVIAGEFLVSKAGLGYLIVYAGQVFKMDLVMMSVVMLGFIAFLMYSAVSGLEKLAVKIINHI